MAKKKSSIKFNYQKTHEYRNHHVDGAFGGVTPKGYVSMLFYSERNVLPRVVEMEVDDKGKLGKTINTEGKEGIIREVESGITMDIGTAISIKDWLENIIAQYQMAQNMNK